MYKQAIILINNKQYLAIPDTITYVDKLNYKINKIISISKILFLLGENKKIIIGKPYLNNYRVKILILDHIKNKKIIIFKKKRRKGYNKKSGYRHKLTKIKILSIKKNGS